MSTHTPGPWKVAGSCHVLPTVDGLYYHVAHVTVADDYAPNPMIAEVSTRGRYCSRAEAHSPSPEQTANARLIAAAPDLLAALEWVIDYAPTGADEARCRAAIAKARGTA